MPGKKQLKQFAKDILELGDEVKIRTLRAEKPSIFTIPDDISDTDDSEDFVLGLPDNSASDSTSTKDETERDIAVESNFQVSNDAPIVSEFADLDEILKAVSKESSNNSTKIDTPSDDSFLQNNSSKSNISSKSLEDMTLDDLLGSTNVETPLASAIPNPEDISLDAPDFDTTSSSTADKDLTDFGAIDGLDDIASIADLSSIDDGLDDLETSFGTNAIQNENIAVDEVLSDVGASNSDTETNIADERDSSTNNEFDENLNEEDLSASDKILDSSSDATNDEYLSEFNTDLNEVADLGIIKTDETAEKDTNTNDNDDFNFDMDDDLSQTVDLGVVETSDFTSPDLDISENAELSTPTNTSKEDDFSADLSADFDLSVPDTPIDFANEKADFATDLDNFADLSIPETSQEKDLETFDTTELDNLDFSNNSNAEQGISSESLDDFDFQETDSKLENNSSDSLDFDPNDDFSIPGFSDTNEVDFSSLNSNIPAPSNISFKSEKLEKTKKPEEQNKANFLTEEEYAKFKKNLARYPLNVRLAIEELIVKNEFTDEAIFDVIHKIIKKQSARQIASALEKLLDISLSVPRDFEHRTAEEYEAYKTTLEYQLRNRIIPTILVSLVAGFVVFFLFLATRQFIYRPLKANSLYKQGYSLLQSDAYPQAEQLFKEAVTYKQSKKWFFKFARGYRERKQHERASLVYKDILYRFKNDKTAGLEYSQMQWKDLADYDGAIRTINDQVLLYHVNDKDGLLQLGDIYLDWGDNTIQEENYATEQNNLQKNSHNDLEPSTVDEKYEKAREYYASLLNLYNNSNLYLSRLMRYFIRKDNLSEVLRLKEGFFPNKKSLGAQDLTELSEYLFEKTNTQLSPAQAYLRESITDIRELMERAIKADPENPVALYNMARYFVQMSNTTDSLNFLNASQQAFSKRPSSKAKDAYKWIDSYLVEGEIYLKQKEILKAYETFTDGISLYKNYTPALKGNKTIGELYGNMANIDYFKYNNTDAAFNYYKAALENDNDTPEIRYKLGSILYEKSQFSESLASFITTAQIVPNDDNLLMALGNVLMQRNSYNAAKSYYEDLLKQLDIKRAERGLLLTQVYSEDTELVEMYMKASNNLGVALYNLAKRTGNSALNGKAMVELSQAMRAWDSLTRNPETVVRLPGSNLAEQNMQYITRQISEYEPAIFPDIPRTLVSDKGLN